MRRDNNYDGFDYRKESNADEMEMVRGGGAGDPFNDNDAGTSSYAYMRQESNVEDVNMMRVDQNNHQVFDDMTSQGTYMGRPDQNNNNVFDDVTSHGSYMVKANGQNNNNFMDDGSSDASYFRKV